jgi:hypothetical protein
VNDFTNVRDPDADDAPPLLSAHLCPLVVIKRKK